jgi:hypothetical protein
MPGESAALTQRTISATRDDDAESEAERFITDLRQRFHSRLPRRSRLLDLHRVLVPSKQGLRRVLLEQLGLRPSDGGAQTEWWLIAWHLDRIDVDFRKCSSHAELRQAAREYPACKAERRRKV